MAGYADNITGLPEGYFRASDAMSTSFGVLSRHIVTFVVLAGIIWLPYVIIEHLVVPHPKFGEQIPQSEIGSFLIKVYSVAALALILDPLCNAVLLHATFQDLRGRPVSMGQSVSAALIRLFPLILLTLAMFFGVVFGMILLIIPGMFFSVAWKLSVPVCVLEQRGPFESMGRSWELTRGNRWKLFGMMLVVGLITGFGAGMLTLLGTAIAGEIGRVITMLIALSLAHSFSSVFFTVVYRDLRTSKEGIDTSRVAEVFN
jgi:hypothetical protein